MEHYNSIRKVMIRQIAHHCVSTVGMITSTKHDIRVFLKLFLFL